MKSIEERAMDFGCMLRENGESEDSYTSGAAGYQMGAKKQRTIDIDKACEWLANPSNDYFPMIKKGWQEAFRKAMED